MTESEYWSNLQLIRGQVDHAVDGFYTELEIHKIASEQPKVFRKLDQHAAFWNLTLYGLQSTFFMTLGRIFDKSDDSLSIHRIISTTLENRDFFSKTALRGRKIAEQHGRIPDWLERFMKDVYEPTTSDLRALKKAVVPVTAKFNTLYRPIRNKIFGHNIVMSSGLVSELFNKIQIKEIDGVLYFLHDLVFVLQDLFQNGRKPELGRGEYCYKQRIREGIQNMLFDLAQIRPKEKGGQHGQHL